MKVVFAMATILKLAQTGYGMSSDIRIRVFVNQAVGFVFFKYSTMNLLLGINQKIVLIY